MLGAAESRPPAVGDPSLRRWAYATRKGAYTEAGE